MGWNEYIFWFSLHCAGPARRQLLGDSNSMGPKDFGLCCWVDDPGGYRRYLVFLALWARQDTVDDQVGKGGSLLEIWLLILLFFAPLLISIIYAVRRRSHGDKK